MIRDFNYLPFRIKLILIFMAFLFFGSASWTLADMVNKIENQRIEDTINAELDKTKQKRSLAIVTSKDSTDTGYELGLSSTALIGDGGVANVDKSFYGKVTVGEIVCVAYRRKGEMIRYEVVADERVCKK